MNTSSFRTLMQAALFQPTEYSLILDPHQGPSISNNMLPTSRPCSGEEAAVSDRACQGPWWHESGMTNDGYSVVS